LVFPKLPKQFADFPKLLFSVSRAFAKRGHLLRFTYE